MKRLMMFFIMGIVALQLYGCFALLAGAVGGAGTAVWLSGKLTQEVNAPYERAIKAAKSALEALKMPLDKETQTEQVTQLRSEYTNGKEVWVDIRPVTMKSSKIEIRVGAVSPDRAAADEILRKIQRYL